MAELSSFQLIPSIDAGFEVSDSKKLIDGLKHLGSSDCQLIIDNQAKANYLRFILRVDKRVDVGLINKLINDIDPRHQLVKIKYQSHYSAKLNYHLSKHFAYPLFLSNSEDEIASLISSLQQSSKQKVRLVLRLKPSSSIRALYLRNRLLKGYSPKLYTSNGVDLLKKAAWLSFSVLSKLLTVFKNLADSDTPNSNVYLPVTEEETISLLDKLYDNLWKTSLSMEIQPKNLKDLKLIESQIDLAIASINQKASQQLGKKAKGANNIFSSKELATVFHLPVKLKSSNTFELSRFKSLESVPELMTPQKGSLILGENIHGQHKSSIYIKSELRQRHFLILGATGSGKSTLLANMIRQDLNNGSAFTLIDPHGDLAADLFSQDQDESKVLYLDPSDSKKALGINLLEISSPKDTPAYQQELDLVVEGVISLFRKLFSDDGDSGGHRVEYLIRNSVYTALSVRNCTIFTVYRILTDPLFRQKVVSRLKSQDLINFWQQELGKAGDYQRVKMSAGVTAKIGRLLYSSSTRRFFGQPKSTINFDEVLNRGQSLVCNLSKGALGEESTKLFGITILTKLQITALKRSTTPIYTRRPYYLYIDEFQTFATPAATQLLSESRKYKLFLTIANQSLSQLEPKLSSVILANVGNLVCFRDSSVSDEAILLPLFRPYLNEGDILNLPSYNFYFKSTCLDSLPPVSGRTLYTSYQSKVITKKEADKTYRLSLRLRPSG